MPVLPARNTSPRSAENRDNIFFLFFTMANIENIVFLKD
jgi:hypothetical protein